MDKRLMALQGVYIDDNNTKKGISCPSCGCSDIRTSNTLQHENKVTRYKKCRNCGKSMRTCEVIG